MKLYLENVRSFEGWHEIPIAPATVLLGENSAGKSTILGMLAAVNQPGFPFRGNFFNQFPFEFGGYKTLACNKKGVAYFSVGLETTVSFHGKPRGVIAAFRECDGFPVLCHLFFWDDDRAVVCFEPAFEHIDRIGQIGSLSGVVVEKFCAREVRASGLGPGDWMLAQIVVDLQMTGKPSAIAFAPMRSRPKRTYDQLSDEFSAEGDHVPLLLARATDPNNKQAKALHEALSAFGRYSEMFTDIGVKQLGRGSGDPFQVQVKMGTKKANLMDVGYGVSQVLPLIVDAQRAGTKTMLLLQQPEVHLHPKAQAALGSMVKDWVSKSEQVVVVETHSDYLVDRLRLEVKRGNLSVGDLKIYFLEKSGNRTTLHALDVDAQGNVLNAPDGYRDFFLREQMALLVD